MRRRIGVGTSLLLLIATTHAVRASENTCEFSVQVSATVEESPPQIRLNWLQDCSMAPSSYTVYRKAPGDDSWGKGIVLPGKTTAFTDTNVTAGTAYEYQIVKATSQYNGYGYICAGMKVPAKESRGRLLLVVDNTYASNLASELGRLQQDLIGDGWLVTRLDVGRKDSVVNIKRLIKAQYDADPANVNTVFLFGHVPVPYSGDMVPDGHAPDHQGAWPSDGFYGDMEGVWTDSVVNDRYGVDARTRNIPGDGKYDQNIFPAPIKLMVGRVDLANMPGRLTWDGAATFPNELELLRNYLNKDHKFRQKEFDLPRRAMVGDYFGVRDGEAFAASGWRNFAPLLGTTNVTTLPKKGTWITTLSTNACLWAYGAGPGSYTSLAGLGRANSYNDGVTTEMVQYDVKAVFTLLFGSWLGDWDSEDNIQRSILALPSYGLTCAWSGRPHWFLHHMALGETIGFSARLTQNNRPGGLYRNQVNSCAGQTHIALMGDPSLRMHTVAPPTHLIAKTNGTSLELTWTPSSDSVEGYFVYRAPSPNGPFTRLTPSLLSGTNYSDPSPPDLGAYMVRAVKLEASGSGTYYNPSQGSFLTPAGVEAAPIVVARNSGSRTPVTESGSSPQITEDSSAVLNPIPSATSDLVGTNVTGATKSVPASITAPATQTGAGLTGTGITVPNSVAWVNDTLPEGAIAGASGGDSWIWVTSNPAPLAGTRAHRSSLANGLHQHFFSSATRTLTLNPGENLLAYVYLDPNQPPNEVMLQWNDGTWEHRAYWGANLIPFGSQGTPSLRYMGPLPALGKWIRLEVPASQVGLEGHTINGMAFSQYGGRVSWDYAGKISNPASSPSVPKDSNLTIWVEDGLPAGAVGRGEGGDSWRWVKSNPAPYSGASAHQSSAGSGMHQHYFTAARSTLRINGGESLFAYVYLDPRFPPKELMLQWNNGSWEHRAYWGANRIAKGVKGTASQYYVAPLPPVGQWALLQVPASKVGLENMTLSGMAFSEFGGRATWDISGKISSSISNPPVIQPSNPTPVSPQTNNPPPLATNGFPGLSILDYATLALPPIGANALRALTPSVLELRLINTKQADPAPVSQWDLVDGNGNFLAPPVSAFTVTANGQPIAVTSVGFKRRPLYAPFEMYDLRIENSMYLQLATPVADNQVIEVKNPGANLWPASMQFISRVEPLRFSPAIHVNQEGYMPNYSKKAMVGYYLGSLGEMDIPAGAGFKLVDANTGAQVFQGTLSARPDSGWTYGPAPYQKVYEADFTSFNTPGDYRLVVPGLGGSLPFLIDNGIAMNFARAYELGLYHQRCGGATAMPYTRFTHDPCHVAPASVPMPPSSYDFTWTTIANYGKIHNPDNPPQTAPLMSASSQLFPFVRQGTLDTSGGHHDAGDYSKYTCNSANLIHYLMFAADSLAGVAQLDNLGIPESGDGISDVLQEAKWEADYLAKIQDSDGGFYFLTYPVNREYEGWVTPDHGDPQVVWPKTTSVTAAAVAALAQCASSPAFKRAYPAVAAQYLQKAQLGWQFLMTALSRYGQTGAYQRITHYGDVYTDQDELAWAACEMYLATGDQSIHQKLLSWFDPADPATHQYGWQHLTQCYGHAIRSYAFAARSGRVAAGALNSSFLSKCETEVIAAGDDVMHWSQMSAYGTAFPEATKRVLAAGWYFSTDQAFDVAVAYQLNAKPDYMTALLANMNYEGGCNPVNVAYITGMGWKRQKDIVSQWHSVSPTTLPPSGIPVGNVTAVFPYTSTYGSTPNALCFPSDSATTAPYPFYDRWGDSWNVMAEMVILNQARSLAALSFLAAQTSSSTQPWSAVQGQITVPSTTVTVGTPVTLTLQAPGVDLSNARITWEARDQEASLGPTLTYSPKNNGVQNVQAEAQMPDGRRIFAISQFSANAPNIIWMDDAPPSGATTGIEGGDSWNWISGNPAPQSGALAHQSTLNAGSHQHFFHGASATLGITTGDVLYAYVYLDPANPPSEVMLQWNDGTWEHRAYWGANSLMSGIDGTASRRYVGPLPAAGQWVQLKVPASQAGLEGSTLNGMAFTLFGGRATWDTAGRLSAQQ